MAISTLCYLSSTQLPHKVLILTVPRTPPVLTCKAHSPYFPIHSLSSKSKCYLPQPQNTAFMRQLIAPKSQTNDQGGRTVGFSDFISKWVGLIRSVLPDGSFWSLIDHKEEKTTTGKPVTLFFALCRMWALLEDDKWVIFVALFALSVAAFLEISMPSILVASIFAAQTGETIVFSRNSKLLLLLCIISGICSGLRSECFSVANMILVRRLREVVFSAVVFQDIYFFDREAVGDLTSRLGADCQRLSNIIGININLILRNALQGTGALINLLILSWPLALSALVICSLLSAIFLLYAQYIRKAAKLSQDFTAGANQVAQETLSLMKTVRVYGSEEKELGRFKEWLEKVAYISTRESMAYGIWNLSFNTLYRSTQIFAVFLGGMSLLTGHVSAEQLTKYVLYCEWLIYATWRITDNISSLVHSVGASEKVLQLMDLKHSEQFLWKGTKLKRVTGHLKFVNVSFYYSSREEIPVLDDVNISIPANEVVAIVGPSGCGKSTLVNLLLRLYEPSNGQIYVDGFPLGELDIRWLREKIGFVAQEPHLLHMDIKSNIKYGCSRHIKQEDIEWAAKQAYAHDFILSLPDAYETLVNDSSLSGGQKQRIAIARAIIRNPSILILDEATSALDSESEHYIEGVIHAFKNDNKVKRTVIVVAHRLSTIRAADRIIVMDGGRVIEGVMFQGYYEQVSNHKKVAGSPDHCPFDTEDIATGDHKELILKDGLYAKLIRAQRNGLD